MIKQHMPGYWMNRWIPIRATLAAAILIAGLGWNRCAAQATGPIHVNSPAFDAGTLTGGFAADKTEYFVGEPIYLTFRVFNTGSTPIRFANGGDYRGTGRHERFSIKAWDAMGRPIPDPVKPSMMGGGLGGDVSIAPRRAYSEELLANLWCSFTEPGTYTIECRRELVVRISEGSTGPEAINPSVPLVSRLTISLRRDDAALENYLNGLASRAADDGRNDAARGFPNGTTAMRARDELRALALSKNDAAFKVIAEIARRRTLFADDAVRWVSEYGKERASPVLRELARPAPAGNANGRRAALSALVSLDAEGVGAVLLEALSSPEVDLRREAVMGCTRIKPPECFAKLMDMADDPDPIVRRYLGAALSAYGNTEAVPVLLELLDDPDPDRFIRIWAASGLGKLGRRDGIPVLIELLRDPGTQDYRGNVIHVLSELTGQQFPQNYEPWKRWWDDQRAVN